MFADLNMYKINIPTLKWVEHTAILEFFQAAI